MRPDGVERPPERGAAPPPAPAPPSPTTPAARSTGTPATAGRNRPGVPVAAERQARRRADALDARPSPPSPPARAAPAARPPPAAGRGGRRRRDQCRRPRRGEMTRRPPPPGRASGKATIAAAVAAAGSHAIDSRRQAGHRLPRARAPGPRPTCPTRAPSARRRRAPSTTRRTRDPGTRRSTLRGRNGPVWRNVWARANGVPRSMPERLPVERVVDLLGDDVGRVAGRGDLTAQALDGRRPVARPVDAAVEVGHRLEGVQRRAPGRGQRRVVDGVQRHEDRRVGHHVAVVDERPERVVPLLAEVDVVVGGTGRRRAAHAGDPQQARR